MAPEHEARGPRRNKADPALRFTGKEETEEPRAGSRPAGAWKKASARIRAAEARTEPQTPDTANEPGLFPVVEGDTTGGEPRQAENGPDTGTVADALGQNVPKYRQRSHREDTPRQDTPQGKYRQQSQQARPADRLRHGNSGEGGSSGGEAAGSDPPEPEPLRKSRLRMEKRETKLNKSREKLARQKPYKPPGPVRRVAGYAGRSVHGFVHGKIYEAEQENVGIEGAHRSELVGEAVGRRAVRFAKAASEPARPERCKRPRPAIPKRRRTSAFSRPPLNTRN